MKRGETNRSSHIGSDFDAFLAEEGILGDVETIALKRVVAWRIEGLMAGANLTRTEMAARMGTSRAALGRLLDPTNESLTLATLQRAAAVLGKRVRIDIV
jgi:hypothetical protein